MPGLLRRSPLYVLRPSLTDPSSLAGLVGQ